MKNQKKLTPLMICHLLAMTGLAIFSIISVIGLCYTALNLKDPAYADWRSPIYASAVMSILDVLALGCGALYLLNGYSKPAARFYRAFLVLTACSSVAGIAANLFLTGTESLLEGMRLVSDNASSARILFHACIIVLLCILAFGKDLGKRRSWAIFASLLMCNVIISLLSASQDETLWTIFAKSLSHFVMTGTIGLAIKGKYDDKDARGTT